MRAALRANIVRHADRGRAARIRCVGDLAGNAAAILAAAARGASAPARGSSSRPSCRCAAIRPRTCCCGRRSSTPARASSPRSPRRCSDTPVLVGFPGARRTAGATTRSPCCATAASTRRLSQAAPAELHGVRRGALLRAGHRAVRLRRRRRCASGSSSARTSGFPGPSRQAKAAGAQVIVVANGSPYHTRQQALRREQVERAGARDRPAVRLRQSRRRPGRARVRRRVVRRRRRRRRRRSSCRRGTRRSRSSTLDGGAPKPVRGALDARLEPHVYDALVMGVRDYVGKNRFPGVLLGLSGGIDSALTLAVAVDALGPRSRARGDAAVAATTRRSASRTRATMAGIVGVRYDEIPIEPVFAAFLDALAERVPGPAAATPPRRTSRRASAARC